MLGGLAGVGLPPEIPARGQRSSPEPPRGHPGRSRGSKPIDPDSVRRYLDGKFGDDLKAVRSAMQTLAKAKNRWYVVPKLGLADLFNDEALTLGKAVAGLNAYSKGRRLGIYKPHEEKLKKAREKERIERLWIEVLGRPVGHELVIADKSQSRSA